MHHNDGRIVSNVVLQALQGEPLTVYGNGMQTRSFCYVADLTEALERLMNSPEHVAGPVNIGNQVELTVLDLAKRVLALTGSQSIIKYRPLPIDDPKLRRPDVSQARELLGWQERKSKRLNSSN